MTGTLSSGGSFTKGGTGTLALDGTGNTTGTINVGAGTLLVNGDYSAATGATMVASGASLGGTGTIGGNVTMADGAILTPGSGGAGTLTIGGNLTLSGGTQLSYEFGQANTAGGGLNDLVNVDGNLTLDGTIDVTETAGGVFGAGIYRVFNYGGTLTDNGLTVGGLPMGSTVSVQTSVAGQINLVNSAGLMLNFWDGAAGPKDNGEVNGGTGIWQNSVRQQQLDRRQRQHQRRLCGRFVRGVRRRGRNGYRRQQSGPGQRGRDAVRCQRLYRRWAGDRSARSANHDPRRRWQHGGRRVHRHGQRRAHGRHATGQDRCGHPGAWRDE